jgi:hypothetical protein
MNADVLTTRVADGIAVITVGTARRIYEENITSPSRSIVVEARGVNHD